MGRTVHMDFVREHLITKKKVDLDGLQDRPNNIDLEIMADTVYFKVLMITTISSQMKTKIYR